MGTTKKKNSTENKFVLFPQKTPFFISKINLNYIPYRTIKSKQLVLFDFKFSPLLYFFFVLFS